MEKLSSYNKLSYGSRQNLVRKYSKYIEPDEACTFGTLDFNQLIESYVPNKRNKFLNDAVAVIQDLCDEFQIDLHPGNIMMRKSQLVFTDPIYDTDKREANILTNSLTKF